MPELPDVEVFKRYLDATALHQEITEVAIAHRVNPEEFPNHYLLPHRRKGGQCPRCHGEVDTIKISGRTAYYCPRCQQQ